uniref:Outer membrane protein beta-barrel domain-containing protein n=1 Tax=candidate division WOR-3 bacterium TaxID=2052148 RepID=A0A7C4XLL2_UNCW3
MKKLMAVAIALSMFSGLSALSLGLGVAYENLAGPEGTDPYLAIKADATVPVIPVLDWRLGLLNVSLPKGNKSFSLGTGLGSDLLIKIPMAGTFQPYIPFGFELLKVLEEGGVMMFALKGGLGGSMGFGGVSGYLEGGINLVSISNGESHTDNAFYVQVGVKMPVGL